MARDSQYTVLFPWYGSLATQPDPIIGDPQYCTQLDNVILTNYGSKRKRGGQVRFNSVSLGATSLIYGTDYWATVSNAKRPAAVTVKANPSASVAASVYRSISWVSTGFTNFNTTALRADQGGITSCVFNNDLVMGFKNNGTTCLRVWNDQATTTLAVMAATSGTIPARNWIVGEYRRRLWVAGDPTNPDVLTFSKVADRTAWAGSGNGRGGNLTIGTENDKDPQGITAIMPGLAGEAALYVAKRASIYRVDISDPSPDNWGVYLLSDGLGVVNPNAWCAVDQQDVAFVSDRGAHLLSQLLSGTTYREGAFLSAPIHKDFQEVIDAAYRNRIVCTWYAPLNSILISTKIEDSDSMDTVYLFNIEQGPNEQVLGWYRWTSVPCNFIWTRFNSTSQEWELYGVGERDAASADKGFVNKLNQSGRYDFSTSTPINVTIRTMNIYSEPKLLEKNFLGVGFIYRGRDNSQFTTQYAIDSQTIDTLTYQQYLLGNFILGSSTLGVGVLGQIPLGIKPNVQHTKGVGHEIQLKITHTTANADLEIFGLIIETKEAGESQNSFRKISV